MKEQEPHNLVSGHFGNGILIWIEGTNNSVAHISPNREITWYNKVLTNEEKEYIKHLALTDDRNISASQDEKVFKNRPKDLVD